MIGYRNHVYNVKWKIFRVLSSALYEKEIFSMRYSHQRELILREVLSRSDYPTAEQICTSLRAVCPRLSLGTVYRDRNTLVDIGKVRRVSIPGEADRFEGPQEDHQQLYCRSCQKVKSIHISDAKLKALIDACPDIVPEDYSLTVFGLCDECAAKAAQETEKL